MRHKILFFSAIGIIIALIIGVWLIFFRASSHNSLTIKPTYGTFYVTVTTTGELQSRNSIEVRGPAGASVLGISQMKIARLVPEGTVVKAGDFVAELDKSEIMQKIKERELSMQKFQSQYTQARLDSTLTLSQARDELENLKYSVEEKQLLKQQSAYEPPAVIRQAEIDFERAERTYAQAKKSYATKVRQAVAKLTIAGADLSKEKQMMDRMMETFNQFTINAPAPGMVIYAKEWNGRRKVVGSTISFWDPVVATLPDLSTMESITYVNEADIQKIKNGQTVRIGLDANPGKKIWGNVVKVANIGEQLRNSDSKVFEVHVQLNNRDTTLLPSMTTSNEFVVATINNSLFIPIECLETANNKNYVYKKNGSSIIRQEVETGMMNENEVIIKRGIRRGDEILATPPGTPGNYKTISLK